MQLSRQAPPTGQPVVAQTILGIDPSLRGTGYGVIIKQGSQTRVVTYGVIKNGAKLGQSECLSAIHAAITAVINENKPDVAAVEGVIYLQNFQTAITLGAARGAALLAIAQAGIMAHEYAPRRIKAATTGQGAAQKYQVSFMMRALLGLKENPPPDAADALAVALTHAQHNQALKPAKQI
jgi:crossover junction endodeoxyribonuclease RuvC